MQALFKTTLAIICLILMRLPVLQAQDSAARPAISRQQWQQLTSDKALGYKNEVEFYTPPKPPPDTRTLEKLLNVIGEIFSSPVWGILLWALFIAVVAYIIYIVVLNKGNFLFKRKSRNLNQDDGDGMAEPFETIDWEKLTQKALQANDLRLAIRYSYMRLLQLMQEKQLIRYRDDKTNFEYSMELAPTIYSQPFRQLSRQYEFAFYGNYIPSEAAYREFEAQFTIVKKQLGTNG